MIVTDNLLPDVKHAKLFKTHVQGAIVRSVASLLMWLVALLAFWFGEIQISHFSGISYSVLFLILINPPTLFFLRYNKRKNVYVIISLVIHVLEIAGYTAIIYSLGGIEASYLTPIYATLIAYIGAVSPRRRPFIVAILCAFFFGSMVALDGLGIIHSQKVDPNFNIPLSAQFFRAFAVIALLFIVAYFSSFTAVRLRQGRDRLRRQNKDLEEKTIQLENSQRELKEAHKGLETTVAKLYSEINERKKTENERMELEEKLFRSKKMESLGLLAGGVAHDLNNVLSGIVSYPDLILIDLPEDSKLRNPIETIQESGQRATAIVQDLLTVARGVAIPKEVLNLNDLIGDYLHSPEFKKLEQFKPTIKLKTNLDRDLFNISGSLIHIRKTVMNLVSNAAEAIEGSGNVTISTVNRYVDRPLRGYDDVNIGEYVVLAVSDDGSGIPSDDLERIFEPFYTKKIMGRSGTGLGLAVVWNVVQDHKGYVDVVTGENGTTFELYFPITRDEMSDKTLSIPIKDYKGNGETILVVDDVESQREISCKMLDKLGYKNKAVSSGEEAVEYLKENTADLLLLDMIMDPGINGRETYEKIIEIHPKQKAIIISGFAETDEVKQAQKLGAGQYIKKPVTLEKIGLAVKRELEK